MHQPPITLLTDFGLTDAYVGIMKGVIAQINPAVAVIDLTHAIPPQNIALANFQLGNAYVYFPRETIHVVVVDPGVGGKRRAIACQTDAGIFVGPDNGVLTTVLAQAMPQLAVELTNSDYWRTTTPSTTFHGRDIFAPVAAHLATGIPLTAMGTRLDLNKLTRLEQRPYESTEQGVLGRVQAIDHFGNLITNIPAAVVPRRWWVEIGERRVVGGLTYGCVGVGEVISLIGSHGWLEVAVNGGSAQDVLGGEVCDLVFLHSMTKP